MPYVRHGDVRLHYDVVGDGPGLPLLLTHGMWLSSRIWRPNLAALGRDRPVVTWDLRGHGLSDAPTDPAAYSADLCLSDIAALLDQLGLSRVVLGGLSVGGYLTLAFHHAHRERVAGLVLVDTGPGFRQDADRANWNAYARQIADRIDTDGLAGLPAVADADRDGPRDPRGLALATRGILPQHDARVIESLPGIEVPVQVVVGADDTDFLKAGHYLASRIPSARSAVIPAAGHVSNVDQPDVFNSVVSAFLRSIDAAGPDAAS